MRGGMQPFTLVIEDPMDHSFIYSPAADGFEDEDLKKVQYTRTQKEEEEYGLTDMITEGYMEAESEEKDKSDEVS